MEFKTVTATEENRSQTATERPHFSCPTCDLFGVPEDEIEPGRYLSEADQRKLTVDLI